MEGTLQSSLGATLIAAAIIVGVAELEAQAPWSLPGVAAPCDGADCAQPPAAAEVPPDTGDPAAAEPARAVAAPRAPVPEAGAWGPDPGVAPAAAPEPPVPPPVEPGAGDLAGPSAEPGPDPWGPEGRVPSGDARWHERPASPRERPRAGPPPFPPEPAGYGARSWEPGYAEVPPPPPGPDYYGQGYGRGYDQGGWDRSYRQDGGAAPSGHWAPQRPLGGGYGGYGAEPRGYWTYQAPVEPVAPRPVARPPALLDTDRDGVLSADEVAAFHEAAFMGLDVDRDGVLTVEEFGADVPPGYPLDQPVSPLRERRHAQFRALDADRDGVVSQVELMAAARRGYQASDLDGDGIVSVWEYRSRPRF